MSIEKVKEYFQNTEFEGKILEFNQSSATVELAAQALNCEPDRIAKMIPFDKVEELTGHAPGGVCPFALAPAIKVYLDESLKKYDFVYPAAGSSNSAVQMTIPQLEKYSSNFTSWIDVTKIAI